MRRVEVCRALYLFGVMLEFLLSAEPSLLEKEAEESVAWVEFFLPYVHNRVLHKSILVHFKIPISL